MSRYVLDTDTLTLLQFGHPNVARRCGACPSGELSTTGITVQEQLSGWYGRLTRTTDRRALADLYPRLADSVQRLGRLPIMTFPESAIARFEQLKNARLNIGMMDLRIAAVVLDAGAILVSRNLRDFTRVPGLTVEDWPA